MRNIFSFSTVILIVLIIHSCKKDKTTSPILITTSVNAITSTSATSGGDITSDGGISVLSRGVCWSTNNTPTIADNKTLNGTGSGIFESTMTGLSTNTNYFVRAYATNSSGTGYGTAMSFTTLPATLAMLTTSVVTGITQNTAICGGLIISDGAAKITARGVCWSNSQNPTITDSKTTEEIGTGIGAFSSSITDLKGNTTYYVRAYATNSAGTEYGNQVSFTTMPLKPSLSTVTIYSITATSCISGGIISNDGGAPVTSRGVCWSISSSPTITDSKTTNGSGTGTFSSSIDGLIKGTIYYVRAYATNSAGTSYGNEIMFTTSSITEPILTTNLVFSITLTSAKSGGNVTSDGGSPITARGVCWSISSNPTITDSKTTEEIGIGIFTSSIDGLNNVTIYYVRAYATNSIGTSYGNEYAFKTYAGTVIDADGNVYYTTIIGTQTWMAENLRTRASIPLVTNDLDWINLTRTDQAYCYYDNLPENSKIYGNLYTWAAATNGRTTYEPIGPQGVCPTGWHLPSVTEWTYLKDFLGGDNLAGGSLKETGTAHWALPNTGATNISGFTGLPAGGRGGFASAGFSGMFTWGHWWSSTTPGNLSSSAYRWTVNNNSASFATYSTDRETGVSVRCIKD
jgi:uncharacterized protein (TIGR02145 family)